MLREIGMANFTQWQRKSRGQLKKTSWSLKSAGWKAQREIIAVGRIRVTLAFVYPFLWKHLQQK